MGKKKKKQDKKKQGKKKQGKPEQKAQKAQKPQKRAGPAKGPITLAIDIGGTGTKMLTLDAEGEAQTERSRELTPQPCVPKDLLALIRSMVAAQPAYDRVSVGFPGVVKHGVVHTAPNLGTERWAGTDLAAEIAAITDKPVRVANDAELQGYGVIRGEGVELVLTLGTGLGTALYTDGRLVPNLELAHHPLTEGKTYEERVCDAELEEIGKKTWSKRVAEVIAQLEPIFNYDVLYIGGGNTKKLTIDLPEGVEIFSNVEGLEGGVRLWDY